ncbi:MAG: hypothetical protein M1816_007261 [Peltula sp. TS41687]|nr:MAG: hypothetical protein M1816_007261 [Peltula sp. TS41687]
MRFLQQLTPYLGAAVTLALAVPSPAPLPHPPPQPLPLVIWHGLGDNYAADGLRAVADLAASTNPGTFIYNIRLASDPSADRTATFFGNLTDEIATVCADLATHPILSSAPAINGLGFSQGGQFLRAYVERCNDPPMRTLVTFGSQHNGIAAFGQCGATDWLCKAALGLLTTNTWSGFVQGRVVPAQFYRDPEPEEFRRYLEHSNFLADVNNEREVKNQTYRENLLRLRKFAMFVFSEDTTAIPKESGWFAEVNGTSGEVTPLREREMYKEDWLGLRALDERGALDFGVAEGRHMELTDRLLVDTFREYFAPVGGEETTSGLEEL